MVQLSLLVVILLSLRLPAAAAQTPPSRTPLTSRWTLIEERRYGNQPGAELADPSTVAVDGAGRLYVADNKPAEVKLFAQDGSLLRTLIFD